jgi:hypothetical protein
MFMRTEGNSSNLASRSGTRRALAKFRNKSADSEAGLVSSHEYYGKTKIRINVIF